MSDKAIVAIEVGMPGLPGNGITSSEKTTLQTDVATLQTNQGVLFKEEGVALATRALSVNVVGPGATVSGTGTEKTITIPASTIPVYESTSLIIANSDGIQFDPDDFNVALNGGATRAIVSLASNLPRFVSATKSSSFSAATTSLADVLSANLGILASGIVYDVELEVYLRCSPDAANDIIVNARIDAASSVQGERSNVTGEKVVLTATATAVVTGAGANIPVACRVEMSAGTGTLYSCHLRARALPRI